MSLKMNNSWIIGPRSDIFFSWGVLVFTGLVFDWKGAGLQFNWARIYYIATLVGGASHIFYTFLPARDKLTRRQFYGAVTVALFICLTSLLINTLNRQVFITILAYFAIYHIFSQQYGFVAHLRRKAREHNETRFVDNLAIWNSMIFALLWWLSERSPIPPNYFHKGDLLFFIPAGTIDLIHIGYWFINGIAVVGLIKLFQKGHPINLGKWSFILVTCFWLYGSMIFVQTETFFWMNLILIHGLFYIGHNLKLEVRLIGPQSKLSERIQRCAIFCVFFLACGFFWRHGKIYFLEFVEDQHFLLPIIWWPLIIHYFFDSFLWRNENLFAGLRPKPRLAGEH